MAKLNPLDYSVFVLVGVTSDDKMKVISYTNWTPKQDEVEKMMESANGAYKGFLLLSPVNIIDKPNGNFSALEIGNDYDIALYTHTQNGVKITYDGDFCSINDVHKEALGIKKSVPLNFYTIFDNMWNSYYVRPTDERLRFVGDDSNVKSTDTGR